ncbi:MAG: DUF222 domain-containing protein [Myxococcales bacterium]|nr:DUF222 domain-containing protein [Myxococcales bacterium]
MDAPRTPDLTHDQADALGEQIAEHATHIDAAVHRLLTDLRTFDASGAWSRQGARSCAEWLAWRLRWDGNTGREHVRVARALGKLPKIDGACSRGKLSYSQLRAMTRVATPENEDFLLEIAEHSTATQLVLICRKYAAVQRGEVPTPDEDADRRRITKRDLDDGMVSINVTLHPDEAELVWAAVTRIAKERAPGELSRVDALVEMADQVVRGTSPERSPTEIVVTIPVQALEGHAADELAMATTQDGTCLSSQAAQRLACDAGLVTMLEGAAGNPLAVGRKTRTISGALWRAVLKRDTTCRFPGCCNKLFLDGHHATHWIHGGETSLGNVLAICRFHHRYLHEYGYRVELDEQQQPTFFDKQGRVVHAVAPRVIGAEVGLPALVRANASLAITATTALSRWDGDEPNYGWIVDGLLAADRRRDVSAETSAVDSSPSSR